MTEIDSTSPFSNLVRLLKNNFSFGVRRVSDYGGAQEGAHDDGSAISEGIAVLLLRLEDQIPETHLLRLIDRYVDFSFVQDRLKGFYSQIGRPSIDPEVLLRLLLVGYLYGIHQRAAFVGRRAHASGLSVVHLRPDLKGLVQVDTPKDLDPSGYHQIIRPSRGMQARLKTTYDPARRSAMLALVP